MIPSGTHRNPIPAAISTHCNTLPRQSRTPISTPVVHRGKKIGPTSRAHQPGNSAVAELLLATGNRLVATCFHPVQKIVQLQNCSLPLTPFSSYKQNRAFKANGNRPKAKSQIWLRQISGGERGIRTLGEALNPTLA